MRLALFDMDHTVLTVNSGMSWLKFLYRKGDLTTAYIARASYWMLLYRLSLLDVDALTDKLTAELEGDRAEDMRDKCDEWIHTDLSQQVSQQALSRLREHKEAGDRVVMITGSSQFAAEPIAQQIGMDSFISSTIEVVDGVFSGKMSQKCFGVHKVPLAEQCASEAGLSLDDAVFYSDSYHDRPLLDRVGEAVAVNADPKLRRYARKRGWRQEDWRR